MTAATVKKAQIEAKKAQIEGDSKARKGNPRLWIDPNHLPTRLAQRQRERQHPAAHWLRKPSDAESQIHYLKLAEAALRLFESEDDLDGQENLSA